MDATKDEESGADGAISLMKNAVRSKLHEALSISDESCARSAMLAEQERCASSLA